MKKFFRQLSFRRKLLISFVTLSCIPVLLVGIAAYHLYTNFIINMTCLLYTSDAADEL